MSWKAFKAYFIFKCGEFWTQTTLAVNAHWKRRSKNPAKWDISCGDVE